MSPAVTFGVTELEPSSVTGALAALGFRFGPSRAATTTLLDTFDGRLCRRGLRLALHETDRLELVLSGDGMVPAHVRVESLPRAPEELPPGPFRARLADVVGLRALLPQLQVRSMRASGVWCDATDKTVAFAELNDRVRVVGHLASRRPVPTIEIHEVTGYPKHARRAAATLDRIGLARSDADAFSLWAAAAGIDLAGYAMTATVPLDPRMPAVDGYRVVLANLADAIAANWQGTIDQSDTEFLHDLRIAVRRSRTVLRDSKGVLPADVRDHARTSFKWMADLTGPARDLDAYLLEWNRYTDTADIGLARALAPVRDLLERRRAHAHLELERGLRSKRAAELMSSWTTWLSEPLGDDQPSDRAGLALGRHVAKRIARAHRTLVERGQLIRPGTPSEQVHDLRKDAKQLRYLLECFANLLPDKPRKRFVRRLKELQDNLGEHQDADVRLAMMRGIAHELHAAGTSPDTLVAIGQLAERLDQQRAMARVEFVERFAGYDRPAMHRALHALLERIVE